MTGTPLPKTQKRRSKKARLKVARRAAPGAAPGTLIADPDAQPPLIDAIRYSAQELDEQTGCTVADVRQLKSAGGVLWIDVCGLADVGVIEAIGSVFGLHRLALEDVVNVHQRPKVELFDEHVFIVARALVPDGGADSEQIAFFVGEDFLLTFQERQGDQFEPVRERLRRHPGGRIRESGPDYLAYALLDAIIDGFFPQLEHYGETIEVLEDEVIAEPEPDQVDRLHGLKRGLLSLRRAIWPTREMINALMRDQTPLFTATTRLYLRDCYDHTVQLIDIVETYREIASGLLEVYLSSQSAKLNEVMKVLTIIATIFIPLSFITGLYGMNFDRSESPWNMPELGWDYGYPAALAVMAAMAFAMLVYFRRKGWLGSR